MPRKNRKYYQNLNEEELETEFHKIPTVKKSRVISGRNTAYEEVVAENNHQKKIVEQYFGRKRPLGFG